ncbi:MAG: translation elongation factor Ts [Jatrophihabitans sp.]
MANISAADVKRLRETTGAGMLDCKKALEEANGDFDAAVEILRVKAGAKVQKRGAERTTSNGLIAAAEGAMIELACETDFVAKNEQLQTLAGDIVAHLAGSAAFEALAGVADPIGSAAKLLEEKLKDGRTVGENVDAVAAVMGEKLELRRAVKLSGQVATYLHKKAADLPAQIGVLVQYAGDDLSAARAVGMQISAMRPVYLSRDDVPAETVEKEKRIAEAAAREEGKPEQAIAKITEGRLNGFFKDNVLLEQSSVHDSKKSVKALLDDAGVLVTGFAHFEIGQG